MGLDFTFITAEVPHGTPSWRAWSARRAHSKLANSTQLLNKLNKDAERCWKRTEREQKWRFRELHAACSRKVMEIVDCWIASGWTMYFVHAHAIAHDSTGAGIQRWKPSLFISIQSLFSSGSIYSYWGGPERSDDFARFVRNSAETLQTSNGQCIDTIREKSKGYGKRTVKRCEKEVLWQSWPWCFPMCSNVLSELSGLGETWASKRTIGRWRGNGRNKAVTFTVERSWFFCRSWLRRQWKCLSMLVIFYIFYHSHIIHYSFTISYSLFISVSHRL